MTYHPLSSSNLKGVDYDPAGGRLTVHFQSGGKWIYAGVPAEHHEGLISASSPGLYFIEHIRGSYPGAPVAA